MSSAPQNKLSKYLSSVFVFHSQECLLLGHGQTLIKAWHILQEDFVPDLISPVWLFTYFRLPVFWDSLSPMPALKRTGNMPISWAVCLRNLRCGAERAQVGGLLNEKSSRAVELYYSQGLEGLRPCDRAGLVGDWQRCSRDAGRFGDDRSLMWRSHKCLCEWLFWFCLLLQLLWRTTAPEVASSPLKWMTWKWLRAVLLLQKTGMGLLAPTWGNL